MPKQIQINDQIVEFPDDMPDNEIEAVLKREFTGQSSQAPVESQQPTQQQEPQISQTQAFVRSATNFPLAPRVKALTSALSAKAMGGDETIAQFYDEALSNELTKLKQARQQYPKTAFAGQLLSDVASGGAVGKLLGLTGTTAKQALGLGAGIGATTALGETPDASNQQGLYDTLSGGMYGAVGGVAGQQVGKAIGKSVPFVKSTVERLKGSTPESVIAKTITPEEAGQQASKLAGRIQEGRITALPELQDENILGLTRILAKTQGSNKIISNYINTKTAGSSRRVADLVNKNISAENYFDNLDTTIARRKELSTPLYEQGYKEGNETLQKAMSMPTKGDVKVGRLRELINDDRIKSAIQTARKDYGINQDVPDISIENLHGARQVVDDIIGSAKRAGENNKARSYIELKNKINNVIYDVAPTMKEADKTFAGFSALKNAQEEGLKFNQYRNGEEVKRAFEKLSDGEKETFKIGVKDYLMDKVSKSSERNPAKAIFGDQLQRKKLQAVFNNPKEFTNFSKKLNDEIRVFDVKQRIVGGSRTDFNIEEQGQLLDKVAKGALNIKTLGIGNVILTATDAIKRRYYGLNEKTANELAKIMVDPEKSVELLNKVVKNAKTAQEKTLIQKFTEDLSRRNFTTPPASASGRAMATEQQQTEEQNAF